MSPRSRRVADALRDGLAVTLTYAVFGWIGLQFAGIGNEVSLVWPSSGIAVAAITLRGFKLWWAVLLGAFVVNLAVGGAPPFALAIALGNTTGALLGGLVLRRMRFDPAFPRRRDVASLAAAAVVSAASAGLGGATVVTGWDPATASRSFLEVFAYWSAGDLLGIMLVAPPIFAWSAPARDHEEQVPWGPILAIVVSALLMLLGPFHAPGSLPVTVIPLIFLIWVALKGGVRWTATACLLLCVIVVVGTPLGLGPFADSDSSRTMALLGLYLGLSGFVSSMLTVLTGETRRAEAALLEREARFRGAFEQAPFAMMLLSSDGRIAAANLRLGALMKQDAASLVGRSLGEWVAPEQREGLLGRIQRFAEGAESWAELELGFCIVGEGEPRQFRARLGGMHHVGVEQMALMQLEDVTSWRRAEAERAMLSLQLAQAQRLDSIGQLAGGVAHDFNNVLQAIRASLDLLGRAECSPEKRAALLYTARGATDRAAALVRQLLDFSRRDPGEQRVFDVRDLVTSTVGMLTRLVPAQVRLTTQLDDRPCLVNADWSQLDQLVLNLCLNARDSIEGDGTVEVSVHASDDGSTIRLEVADDGAGIPPALRERVFEPFFTTKGPGKGTGLGLSVVYGIVQRHRGTITLADAPPRGTRVIVELPAAAEQPTREASTGSMPALVGRGERILLAEDDPHVREVVSAVLEDAGYRVLVATDGVEAVELFSAAAEAPDGVVLDVVMPRMSGHEALARIRERAPEIPALLCTAYDPEELSFSGSGDAPVLRKPCGREELLGALRAALDARRGASGAPGATPARTYATGAAKTG